MNYFTAIKDRCNKLDKAGQAYLDTLDFIPNNEVLNRIWNKATEIFKASGEDWENIPEWVASTMDGHIPYSKIPRDGSLFFLLGWSVVSNDAHLRNLLEQAEGRTTEELEFDVWVNEEELHESLGIDP